MPSLPTGTATFMFTDIEGSTRLVEELGSDYGSLLTRHHEILREAVASVSGVEVGNEGDSFFVVFGTASDAIQAAIRTQRTIAQEGWIRNATVRVRIGIHTGAATLAGDNYVGIDVHRAARIMAAGSGGQILVSDATRALAGQGLAGIGFRDLGDHRLKDLPAPERLFQITADGLPMDFPPPNSLDAIPNNLPAPATALVGRDVELERLHDLLRRDAGRLVTLTGPGGIGKTRLATEAASGVLDHYRDGAFFVDLAHAREPTAVLVEIARTTGLTASPDSELREALVAHLRPRRALLVLDNFEQVMAAADDVTELVRQCPRVTMLVTSREALRVRGEQLVPVPSLSLPGGTTPTLASAAVALFVERGREARPGFGLDDDSAPVVAEICARLDGLPLAIELAAARLKLFSPAELLDRLKGGLEVLRGGARDLPSRQRTLRDTIAWSYELLDDDERALLKVLAVFPSARVDAVEAVCANIDAVARIDVVDRLASLIDKSLVRTVDDSTRQRLRMLETIHDFASDELERDPDLTSAARRAHADHFCAFSTRLYERLRGPERAAGIAELEDDLDNVLAAWRFHVEASDLGRVKAMLDPLWTLHDTRGWYHAAIGLTTDLLGLLRSGDAKTESSDTAVALRLTLARLLMAVEGHTPRVEDLYQETLALASEAGGLPRQVPVLRSLATFYLQMGQLDRIIELATDILAIADAEDDDGMRIEGLVVLGAATSFLGDLARGVELLDRAIELFDADRHGRGSLRVGPSPAIVALSVGALFRWMLGFPDTAQSKALESIALAERLRHPYSVAYATFHATVLDLWSGRLEDAHARAQQVGAIARERDYPVWSAIGQIVEGMTTAAAGRAEEGLEMTERGIELYGRLRTPPVFWPQVLTLRARALLLAGRAPEALDVAAEAIRLAPAEDPFDRIGVLGTQADILLALGDRAGAAATLEEALTAARSIGGRTPEIAILVGLARLHPDDPERLAALRAAYESFPEGPESSALADARQLLGTTVAS